MNEFFIMLMSLIMGKLTVKLLEHGRSCTFLTFWIVSMVGSYVLENSLKGILLGGFAFLIGIVTSRLRLIVQVVMIFALLIVLRTLLDFIF